MQKEHRNIDELFKSGLSDVETSAPAFVKNRIDKKLFGSKKFLLLSIPLLVLLFTITYIHFNTNSNSLSNNKVVEFKNIGNSILLVQKINENLDSENSAEKQNTIPVKSISTFIPTSETSITVNPLNLEMDKIINSELIINKKNKE